MSVEFVLVRIDDRLIHGQVAVGWVKVVSPDVIMVADDTVAEDALQRSLMEMAATPAFGVEICKVKEAVARCASPEFQGKRVLLLLSSIKDVVRIMQSGLKLEKINVGGLRYSAGKKQIMQAVAINDEDKENFRNLLSQGLTISIQMVPTDEPVDIKKFLLV
ncbi:PTS sugar transporter subunit IIB [bacterium]|nr:PTS sugar transporter subunit IIB [bacterium]